MKIWKTLLVKKLNKATYLNLCIKAKSLINIILKCLPNTNYHILQRRKNCPETTAQGASHSSQAVWHSDSRPALETRQQTLQVLKLTLFLPLHSHWLPPLVHHMVISLLLHGLAFCASGVNQLYFLCKICEHNNRVINMCKSVLSGSSVDADLWVFLPNLCPTIFSMVI